MGYILMLLGISSAAVSSVYGSIVKYIPECFVLLLGAIIQGGLVIFLLVWRREPSYAAVIIFVIGWGAADAVWQITCAGMCQPFCSIKYQCIQKVNALAFLCVNLPVLILIGFKDYFLLSGGLSEEDSLNPFNILRIL